MEVAAEIFKAYCFSDVAPHVPEELLRHMRLGREIVEIDEKLYFHIKFLYRTEVFYDVPGRFGIQVGRGQHEVAEFFCQDDRYFLRPPGLEEN